MMPHNEGMVRLFFINDKVGVFTGMVFKCLWKFSKCISRLYYISDLVFKNKHKAKASVPQWKSYYAY